MSKLPVRNGKNHLTELRKHARHRRWLMVGLLFVASLIVVLIFHRNTPVVSVPKLVENLSLQPSVAVLPDAAHQGTLEPKTDDRAFQKKQDIPNKSDIKDGGFLAIASAVKSSDVLTRNKGLEHLKSLARFNANIKIIREELLRMDASDEAFAPIVAALAAVGTVEIQELLRDVVEQRSGDWRCYSAIIPSLGLLIQPAPETIDFLVTQSRLPDPDFSSTAALAVGSIVHTLSKTDQPKGELLLGTYLAKIASSDTSIEDLKECLAVVGNSGLTSAVPILLRHIGHPRADVRADVVTALRFMRIPQVENVLLNQLFREPDLEVRLAIVDALVHGPVSETALEVVMSELRASRTTEVVLREKFLELFLHVNLTQDAKRKWVDWLTRYVESEPDPAVRRKASAALQELARESQ